MAFTAEVDTFPRICHAGRTSQKFLDNSETIGIEDYTVRVVGGRHYHDKSRKMKFEVKTEELFCDFSRMSFLVGFVLFCCHFSNHFSNLSSTDPGQDYRFYKLPTVLCSRKITRQCQLQPAEINTIGESPK